jgi:hypothetical protein
MKPLDEVLKFNYKIINAISTIRKSQAIIIKNLLNVNIFVQHNFKSVLIKIRYWRCDN